MNLNPARCRGYILTMVLCTPTLDKAHTDGTHLGEFVDHLKAMVDVLGEEGSKLLVVEDLERASWRDLADRGRMEAVPMVAVTALDKDTAVTETLCIDLTSNIVQMDTFSDVSPCILYGGIAVDVREETQAEAVMVIGWIRETIHDDAGRSSMEGLPHSVVELIVSNGTP